MSNPIEIPYSYDFLNKWQDWIDYKKEQDFEYTNRGMKAALTKIKRLSYFGEIPEYLSEKIAIAIIDQSLETEGSKKPWKGFFSLQFNDPLMIQVRQFKKESKSNNEDSFDKVFEKYGLTSNRIKQ